MPPTETKSYTPGAERAAREIDKRYAYLNGIEAVAETISRETGDLKLREQNTEMLEVLKAVLRDVKGSNGLHSIDMAVEVAIEILIAKVEGR